jgi:hypothetical protein
LFLASIRFKKDKDHYFYNFHKFLHKVIRVIANSSINPEAGSALALSEKIVDSLLRVAEAAAFSDNDDLLLPTLAALNNLSFYSIVHQKQTYSSLKPFLHCSNVQVAIFFKYSRNRTILGSTVLWQSKGK